MSDLVERLRQLRSRTDANRVHRLPGCVEIDLAVLDETIAALEAQPRLPDGYSLVRKGDDLIECHKHGVECFTSYKASLTFEFLSAFFPQSAQPSELGPQRRSLDDVSSLSKTVEHHFGQWSPAQPESVKAETLDDILGIDPSEPVLYERFLQLVGAAQVNLTEIKDRIGILEGWCERLQRKLDEARK